MKTCWMLLIAVALPLGSRAESSVEIPFPKTDSFQLVSMKSDGQIISNSEGLKWTLQPKKDAKSDLFIATTAGGDPAGDHREVEVFRNSNKILESFIFDSPSGTNLYKLGKNSKVQSQTKCWKDMDCVTVTEGLCKSLLNFTGVKDIQELENKANACVQLSKASDEAIKQQPKEYWDEHAANMKTLDRSQILNQRRSWLQAKEAYFKDMPPNGNKERLAEMKLKETLDGHEMRIFETIQTCNSHMTNGSFDGAKQALRIPTKPTDKTK